MHDERQHFADNRDAIGDQKTLTFNHDASLDLYVHQECTSKDNDSPLSSAVTMGVCILSRRRIHANNRGGVGSEHQNQVPLRRPACGWFAVISILLSGG